MKKLRRWLRYFRTLLKLTWQARDEKPNRAKHRRITRLAEQELRDLL